MSLPSRIVVGLGSCGIAAGAYEVIDEFKKQLALQKLSSEIYSSGCIGLCFKEVLVEVKNEESSVYYQNVTPEIVPRIVSDHLIGGNPVADHLVPMNVDGSISDEFYTRQTRIVLENCGIIDPDSIDDYISRDGYKSLEKVLRTLQPAQVIEQITQSGLRGRGGAGFLTGTKWQFARNAVSDTKYMICNADEGDPGAFMDRSVLEGDPHRVIEGLAIAAYATGAKQGYIYCRAEYPLAIQRLNKAINEATKSGLLGKNLYDSGFDFHLEIKEGAGAFVCGEETALMASIEGKRGMPRLRPPYPTDSGLWGCPTVINNVETLAAVPWIIRNGWKTFSDIGPGTSKGTKVFALAGKVKKSGLVEIPMGMSLREVIFDIGGGIVDDKKFKAVQLGGPSGGCLSEELLDTPIEYDAINATGAIIGSGGMIVMDETTCMVDMAKFFINFVQHESCGKCIPCRIGTMRMLEILTRITKGKAREDDLKNLEILARDIKVASLCGLGQTAPNPVLTTLKYFRKEYEEHIKDRRCSAGACVDLISVTIKEKLCRGCGVCVKNCPTKAIVGRPKEVHFIDPEKCIKCKQCIQHCPFDAIYVP